MILTSSTSDRSAQKWVYFIQIQLVLMDGRLEALCIAPASVTRESQELSCTVRNDSVLGMTYRKTTESLGNAGIFLYLC